MEFVGSSRVLALAKVRAKIVVDGEVQGVGYRYFVRRAAGKFKVWGYVRNLEDGRVEVICEGKKAGFDEFVKLINTQTPPICVESMHVTHEEPTGEFKGKAFTVVTGRLEDEVVEGFSTGSAYFEAMFSKQEGLKHGLDRFREESTSNFKALDEKYHAVSEGLKSINTNIAKLSENIAGSNEGIDRLIQHIGTLVEDYVKTKTGETKKL